MQLFLHTSVFPTFSAESAVPLVRFDNRASVDGVGVTLDGGGSFRELVLATLRPLLEHLLATTEDDTKSLNTVASVSCSHHLRFVYTTRC